MSSKISSESLFAKEPTVTKAQIIQILGLSDRKFRLLSERKVFISISKNEYLLITSMANYIKILDANVRKSSSYVAGKPKAYSDPKDIADKSAEYFQKCYDLSKIPSITGVCNYLGIHRSTLHEYESKSDYSDTIKKIKSIVEESVIDASFDKGKASGAIFSLKCNFGHKENGSQNIGNTGAGSVLIILPHNGRDKPMHPSMTDSEFQKLND